MPHTWRVLVSAPAFLSVIEEYQERLGPRGVVLVAAPVAERLEEEDLLELLPGFDGIISGDDQITDRVLEASPRLKVISKWGTGIDSIDSAAAARRGIPVYRTLNAFTDPVADSVMAYILAFARQIPWMDRDVREGCWSPKRQGMALCDGVLGVVGIGNIGKAVVRRAVAFGMTVLGADPVPVPDAFCVETGLQILSLHDLLARCDFVALACTRTPGSGPTIGDTEIRLMKPGAYLINTARGPLVDEAALARALAEGRLGGAGLDVFEEEPLPADSPLRRLDNCLLSPHNANSSLKAYRRVHESTVQNLLEGFGIVEQVE